MMKNIINMLILAVFIVTGCQTKTEKEPMKPTSTNPILMEWDTPFGVPPFDKIKSEDYLPAFEEALASHKQEIEQIISNEVEPTYENTIEALEVSGSWLSKVANVFYAVDGANTDDVIKETAKNIAPKLAAHSDDIGLNPDLFKRVESVYNQRESLDLNPEELKLLEETYKGFVRSGVNLEGEAKDRLRAINERLASLSQSFGENLLNETNAFEYHTTDEAELGNLTASLRSLAATEAKNRGHEEGWSFTLQRPSINPFLQSSPNREARKILFDGYAMRANNDNENDNKEILQEMARLRLERAKLMGYKSHADYVLEESVAKTATAVFEFMDKIWPSALEMAKSERDALAKKMKEDGIDAEFKGSDWRYYVEKVRKERYDFDEDKTRPYFEVNAVRDGVFDMSNKLFGITFKQLTDVPTWHPDQQVFQVLEADGSHLGIVYMDFFARESKRGGAWMNDLVPQSNVNEMVNPIVTNNFNYPAPTEGSPSLLSFTEAQTLFHEFGHALHGLFSNVKYASLSGTNVPRDFVEFPSQVMENWMSEPEVLRSFAKHYQTGEVIPDEMIQKMKEANQFNEGFRTVEYMAAAYLDMAWHNQSDSVPKDVNEHEKNVMQELGLIEEIIPRYRSTYFAHIFSGGYSSGYYSYLWSEVLDADAFKAFKETGDIFHQETASRYRTMLSKGGSRPGMDLYVEFRGNEPEIEPLMKKKGFIQED